MACMFRVLCNPSKDGEKKAGDYDNDFYLMICVDPRLSFIHPPINRVIYPPGLDAKLDAK
jgi:hypothetical protein